MASSHGPGDEEVDDSSFTTSHAEVGMRNHGGYHHQSAHNQKNQMISPGLSMIKAPPCPGPIVFPHATHNSLTLAWKAQEGQSEPQKFRVTWTNKKKKSEGRSIETESSATELRIQDLGPGQTYDFTVAAVNDRGELGPSASATKAMEVPVPEGLTVKRMETSACLSWTLAPGMEGMPHSFLISYRSSECGRSSKHAPIIISTTSRSAVVTGLEPLEEYTAFVKLVGETGREVSSAACTIPAALHPPECKVLTPTSVSLSWTPAPQDGPTDRLKYCITWRGERSGDRYCTVTPVTQLEVQNLHPGDTYKFTVAAISESGEEIQSVSVSQCMNIPVPENLTVKKTETSADLSWTAPSSMERIPHTFLVCYGYKGGKARFISTASCSAVIPSLHPHTEYNVKVRVVCGNGTESLPATINFYTGINRNQQESTVETFWVKSLTPTSAEVSWTPSQKENQIAGSFQISYVCDGTDLKTVTTDLCSTVIEDLKPASEYLFSVSAGSEGVHPIMLGSTIFCPGVPTPGPIQIKSATPTSVSLMWKSLGSDYGYRVTRKCSKFESTFTVWDSGITIHDLDPGDELDITVFTLRNKQQSSSSSHLKYPGMKIPQPTDLQLDVHSKMVTWKKPAAVGRVSYLLTVTKQGANMFNAFTENTQYTLPEDAFKTDCSCVIYVSTVLKSAQSIPNVVAIDQCRVVTYPGKEAHPAHSQITPTPPSHAVTHTGKEERPINHQARRAPGYADKDTSRQYGNSQSATSYGRPAGEGSKSSGPTLSTFKKKKYYFHASGKTKSYCSEIQNLWLQGLSEVKSVDSAHMILAICMVVSRVGTDVEATLREIPVNKPTVLVVMHHTFDPTYVVPDSRRYAKDGMLVVDCLFYEDQGLLRCETNDKAKSTVLNWIESKIVGTQPKGTSYVNEPSRF
ncbi:usherin-like isoform X2 [Engraulis encrasicolus]|uniref:usherin-like isoform X2 n=1 Tax=Engraulis encrasicolus TaxID=184585 RepID=UPI002FD43E55